MERKDWVDMTEAERARAPRKYREDIEKFFAELKDLAESYETEANRLIEMLYQKRLTSRQFFYQISSVNSRYKSKFITMREAVKYSDDPAYEQAFKQAQYLLWNEDKYWSKKSSLRDPFVFVNMVGSLYFKKMLSTNPHYQADPQRLENDSADLIRERDLGRDTVSLADEEMDPHENVSQMIKKMGLSDAMRDICVEFETKIQALCQKYFSDEMTAEEFFEQAVFVGQEADKKMDDLYKKSQTSSYNKSIFNRAKGLMLEENPNIWSMYSKEANDFYHTTKYVHVFNSSSRYKQMYFNQIFDHYLAYCDDRKLMEEKRSALMAELENHKETLNVTFWHVIDEYNLKHDCNLVEELDCRIMTDEPYGVLARYVLQEYPKDFDRMVLSKYQYMLEEKDFLKTTQLEDDYMREHYPELFAQYEVEREEKMTANSKRAYAKWYNTWRVKVDKMVAVLGEKDGNGMFKNNIVNFFTMCSVKNATDYNEFLSLLKQLLKSALKSNSSEDVQFVKNIKALQRILAIRFGKFNFSFTNGEREYLGDKMIFTENGENIEVTFDEALCHKADDFLWSHFIPKFKSCYNHIRSELARGTLDSVLVTLGADATATPDDVKTALDSLKSADTAGATTAAGTTADGTTATGTTTAKPSANPRPSTPSHKPTHKSSSNLKP